MRITVAVEDLEPAVGVDDAIRSAGASGGSRFGGSASSSAALSDSASRLQFERARTVASSLDLRGAKVQEALEVLDRYLDDASLAGLDQVTIIHGLGTGALRDAVREHSAGHPLVKSWRAGERGEGGDGATIITL
jgi:DNA mismatch repair protein MutS2